MLPGGSGVAPAGNGVAPAGSGAAPTGSGVDLSALDRPLGRVQQAVLTCFGLLLGALVIGSTLAVLAISDARHPHRTLPVAARPAPAPAVPSAVPAAVPSAVPVAVPSPGPASASVAAPSDPTADAQRQVDALVTRFAQSLDTGERAALLVQIRRLAATPGVTVPYR